MKYKLGGIFPGLTVQLFDNAEDLLQQDLSQTKVLIIDNDFGSGKMTGVEAVRSFVSSMQMTLLSLSGQQTTLGAALVPISFGQRMSGMTSYLWTSTS